MAFVRGFDRTTSGALVTSNAAPATNSEKIQGWAVSSVGAAHRTNATAGLPAGAVLVRGRAYSSTGAVCFTTSKPTGANEKFMHGVLHHVNGAMYVKTTAPVQEPKRSAVYRLLYDPSDGACLVDSTA